MAFKGFMVRFMFSLWFVQEASDVMAFCADVKMRCMMVYESSYRSTTYFTTSTSK